MCRLYGFRANEPTKVECTLVHAQNALLIQSRADLRGKSHADGWGIGFYADTQPRVERHATAAFEDLHFSATAERIYSHTVVAHVRKATVGGAALANTHPFHFGPWTFAHNGTVTGFDTVGPRLESETDARFREARQGTTDSEGAFYWLLSRMAAAGISPGRHCEDLEALEQLVGESVRNLAGGCAEAQPEKAAQLNFLLTDGQILIATRWRNSLHWVKRDNVHDCEICGIPHIHHDAHKPYHAVVVASEPISHEAWQEVPDHSLLRVDAEMGVRLCPIADSSLRNE